MKLRISALAIALCMVAVLFAACGAPEYVPTPGATNGDPAITDPTTSPEDNPLNDPSNFPLITITMEDGGIITAVLYPDRAPNTVANFLYLVNQGFYDGLNFHRIMSGFMIQGGCPLGTGTGGADHNIAGEFRANGFPQNTISHVPGVLSMARRVDSYNSQSSQFFIVHGDATGLDGDYTGFGMVIDGMDVVNRLANVPVQGEHPIDPPVIATITADMRGMEHPVPVTLPR